MFDEATLREVEAIAAGLRVEPAALLAVADIESGGKPFALVDGRQEPLIRFEGHYFDRRLDGEEKAEARAAGLANPKAGAVVNPNGQAGRWKMLIRAAEINANAAYESCSYGVGQVMGAHWQWLGYRSVADLVNVCRRDVAGQVEVMARFIDKAGLAGALRARDWATFAKGYNGPGYAKNSYDTKMAAAYRRYANGQAIRPASDASVVLLQLHLAAHGYKVEVDGVRCKQTDAALKAFQKARGLVVDGVAGSATWAELNKTPAGTKPAPTPQPEPQPAPEPEEPQGFWAWLFSLFTKGN